VLESHGVHATFFVVGANAVAHPFLIDRMLAGGHEVANHTLHHHSLTLQGPAGQRPSARWRRGEIYGGAAAVQPLAVSLLRAPYGHVDLAVALTAARCRQRLVGWDTPAGDWTDDPSDVLVERTLDRLRPGGIVLFHDRLATASHPAFLSRAPTIAAVDDLLTRTRRDGWDWVTISQLIRVGRTRLRFHRLDADPSGLPTITNVDPNGYDTDVANLGRYGP